MRKTIRIAKKQRGGMMIESLVGLLVLSIVGAGLLHTSARIANTQQSQNINNLSLNQMRTLLLSHGSNGNLCGAGSTITLPGNVSADVTVAGCDAITITVNNIQVDGAPLADQPVLTQGPLIVEASTNDEDANTLMRLGGSR
jgi:Tfp pilus assembly protein PilV